MHSALTAFQDLHTSVKIGQSMLGVWRLVCAGAYIVQWLSELVCVCVCVCNGKRGAGGEKSHRTVNRAFQFILPPTYSLIRSLSVTKNQPLHPRRRLGKQAVGSVRPREPAIRVQNQRVVPAQRTHLGPRVRRALSHISCGAFALINEWLIAS